MKDTTIKTTISVKAPRVAFVKVQSGIITANFTLVNVEGKFYLNNPSFKAGDKHIDHAYIADKEQQAAVLGAAIKQYEELQAVGTN